MSTPSYKQQKEDFVSGLTGGPVSEIAAVTAVAPVAILLWSALQARHSFFKPPSVLGYLLDFFLNVGAFLLATTLYAGTPVLLILFLLAPVVSVYMVGGGVARKRKQQHDVPASSLSSKRALIPIKPFITSYRGAMMIMTCISILAVDFRLFPRRFAKVETWGTSLMDMGVGSFVFGAGVVAARPVLKERLEQHQYRQKPKQRSKARSHAQSSSAGSESASKSASSLAVRLLYSARHSAPLLLLGIVRLLSVKGLDYAEHVTEYGVHWNFFFTLGFLPPFVALCQSVLQYVPSYAALALLVATVYELVLDNTPLKAYILTAPRFSNILSMNREGVFSFCGYLAIFLAGQDFGMIIIPRNINSRSGMSPASQRNTLLLTMAVWAAIWSALYLFTTSYSYGLGLTVSRRLANLPYVAWVAAFNTIQLLACCVVETVFFPATYNAADARSEADATDVATSRVLRAFNRNGLAVFLVANLLTGLVNMTVKTLDASPLVTMAILLAYMGVTTAVAVVLDVFNISVKL
ncbi:GPI-anchored wall transfer protein [Moelleriella libera RCEF 2490]|uniref:GPI-anchored wall transfer protein n=1 Tax=Moelleriella libera RCEF 2490 TaxID=1081109 RepID=A0A168ET28_9HYPO|nr:GPI-anchored wall transfer protein [Moelleriella libera RCEF 2490]